MQKIVIGTRGSELALIQADLAKQALQKVDGSLEIEILPITTNGDTNQNPIPLDTIGKGWFTREIEEALHRGTIDIAVHSLKDMAETMPEGLTIGAHLPREDARDALITRNGETLETLTEGAIIGTDSKRRGIQMHALRPDSVVKSIRGNVPTRIQKLRSEPYDAVILAVAGLKRLKREHEITMYFDPIDMTPAPGQGILALQVHTNNLELISLMTHFDDAMSRRAAELERGFSKRIGGGCKSPTGSYAWWEKDAWHFMGMVHTEDQGIVRETLTAKNTTENIGITLAEKFMRQYGLHG